MEKLNLRTICGKEYAFPDDYYFKLFQGLILKKREDDKTEISVPGYPMPFLVDIRFDLCVDQVNNLVADVLTKLIEAGLSESYLSNRV